MENPLSNLIKEGMVETVLEDGELYYQLTDKGREIYEQIKNDYITKHN